MSLYIQRKLVASGVSLTPGTVISEWLVSLKDFRCKGILRQVSKMPGIYRSICQGGQEGLHLFLIRPSLVTLQIRGSSQLLCTIHYCCGRRHYKYAAVAYITAQFYYYNTMEGLVSSRGGAAPYRPLCSVLCITRGGQLSTAPCVWFYIEFSVAFGGGDGVRYPPLVGRVEVE